MTETTFEDELSEVALEQVASESKPEINVIMPIIQWLRGFVFVIIGAILSLRKALLIQRQSPSKDTQQASKTSNPIG